MTTSTIQIDRETSLLRGQVRLVRALREDGIVLSWRQHPAELENGDFIRVVRLGRKRWLVALGDVMGRGTRAARLARRVAEHLEERAHLARNLGDLAGTANDLLYRLTDGETFASMLLVLVDSEHGTVRLANAGHAAPLAVGRSGGVVALEGHGPALGLLPDTQFREAGPLRLPKRMILTAMTDGILEAVDATGEPYGRHRASVALAEERENGAKAVARRILEEANDHAAFEDDRTVLAIQFV